MKIQYTYLAYKHSERATYLSDLEARLCILGSTLCVFPLLFTVAAVIDLFSGHGWHAKAFIPLALLIGFFAYIFYFRGFVLKHIERIAIEDYIEQMRRQSKQSSKNA